MRVTDGALLLLLAYELGRRAGIRRALRAVEKGYREALVAENERLRAMRGELV